MKEVELAYIAGIVDGEGCIGIHRQRMYSQRLIHKSKLRAWQSEHHKGDDVCTYRSSIAVSNTNRSVLEYIKSLMGGTIHPIIHNHPKWRDSWEWRVSTKQAYGVAKRLLPYLQIKRKQAELLIIYQDYKDTIIHMGRHYTLGEWDALRQYHNQMCTLNGHPPKDQIFQYQEAENGF